MLDVNLVPIGIDDFGRLRRRGLYYIDKTWLIKKLIDKLGADVFLFPRPRRFGKTLAMTMLRSFFEKTDEPRSAWFEGLSIWEAGPEYRKHFQQYPVIYLTLKDVKEQSAEGFFATLKRRLSDLFAGHRALLDRDVLNPEERERFHAVLHERATMGHYEDALFDLCSYLHRAYGKHVVLLIDEYDTPIHEAYLNGFAEPVLNFFRRFLGSALKGNPYLYKAVLTGILRISKESIFSDLNNISVYSILHPEHAAAFGFTESETLELLSQAGLSDRIDTVRDWYNGYEFGGQVMYNPWSLLNFVANGGVAEPYWLNTSANSLIKESLMRHAGRVGPDLMTLLSGGEVDRIVEENTALGDLEFDEDALFSLLAFAGYLRVKRVPGFEHNRFRVSIPNREVRHVYASTFQIWLKRGLMKQGGQVDTLLSGLLMGDAALVEMQLQRLALATFSYHDTALPNPEKFYHGFILGLLTTLEPSYRVRSNRESGYGCPNVLILPTEKGKPAVVLELKVVYPNRQSLQDALVEGEAQMRAKSYSTELDAAGAAPVVRMVVAFDGKTVVVKKVEGIG